MLARDSHLRSRNILVTILRVSVFFPGRIGFQILGVTTASARLRVRQDPLSTVRTSQCGDSCISWQDFRSRRLEPSQSLKEPTRPFTHRADFCDSGPSGERVACLKMAERRRKRFTALRNRRATRSRTSFEQILEKYHDRKIRSPPSAQAGWRGNLTYLGI